MGQSLGNTLPSPPEPVGSILFTGAGQALLWSPSLWYLGNSAHHKTSCTCKSRASSSQIPREPSPRLDVSRAGNHAGSQVASSQVSSDPEGCGRLVQDQLGLVGVSPVPRRSASASPPPPAARLVPVSLSPASSAVSLSLPSPPLLSPGVTEMPPAHPFLPPRAQPWPWTDVGLRSDHRLSCFSFPTATSFPTAQLWGQALQETLGWQPQLCPLRTRTKPTQTSRWLGFLVLLPGQLLRLPCQAL